MSAFSPAFSNAFLGGGSLGPGFGGAYSPAFYVGAGSAKNLETAGLGQSDSSAAISVGKSLFASASVAFEGIADLAKSMTLDAQGLSSATASATLANGDDESMETSKGYYTPGVGRRWIAKA